MRESAMLLILLGISLLTAGLRAVSVQYTRRPEPEVTLLAYQRMPSGSAAYVRLVDKKEGHAMVRRTKTTSRNRKRSWALRSAAGIETSSGMSLI